MDVSRCEGVVSAIYRRGHNLKRSRYAANRTHGSLECFSMRSRMCSARSGRGMMEESGGTWQGRYWRMRAGRNATGFAGAFNGNQVCGRVGQYGSRCQSDDNIQDKMLK